MRQACRALADKWFRWLERFLQATVAFSILLGTGSSAEAQTLSVEQIERRIVIGFQVDSQGLQGRLPPPWQLNQVAGGPFKGANFFLVLVDNLRTEDPEGKALAGGALRFAAFFSPAINPQTGQTVSVVLGGFSSSPAYVPGFYQVYRAASIRMEHATISGGGDADQQIDAWEVLGQTGKVELAFRLSSLPDASARSRNKSEANVISARNPALWRIYKFDTGTDNVKSDALGIDRIRSLELRVNAAEFADLFDGTERIVGINLVPWYVRQVYVR